MVPQILSPALASGGGGGSGTVTSVAMTVPAFLSVAGSPITTSGTLAVTLATQTANTIFAGPTTGAAAAPTFRSLVAGDIPSLSASYINNSTSAQAAANFNIGANGVIGGTLSVTGATTLSGALTASAAFILGVQSFVLNGGTQTVVSASGSTIEVSGSTASSTIALPASPTVGQRIVVSNGASVNWTLSGNGNNIDGSSTATVYAGVGRTLEYSTTNAWRTTSLTVVQGNTFWGQLAAANTWTAANTFSVNGAASTPPVLISGTIFTGGSATTTKPQLLIEPSGTTSTNWSTSGTVFGGNAASGFAGNLIDLQVAASSKFKVNQNGLVTATNGLAVSGSGGIAVTCSGTTTWTGASVSLNASSNFNVSLCTGTSTGTVAIGGGSGSVSVSSTTWNVTTAGAVSGVTTIAASGTIYSSGGTIGGGVFALTDGASIAIDLSKGNVYTVTLGGNRTLANPTNATAGTAFRVAFKQDGTGGRTISFGANYDTAGFTALTGTANKIQEVYFLVVDSTHIRVLATNLAEFTN